MIRYYCDCCGRETRPIEIQIPQHDNYFVDGSLKDIATKEPIRLKHSMLCISCCSRFAQLYDTIQKDNGIYKPK